jgi:hypothetical protein
MSLAYNVGYNARLYGYAKLKECPYLKGTFCYTDWQEGWKHCDATHTRNRNHG